ncbi:MAG TPA: Asp23/Gls24 family envelope stress response protein [Anaerolineae bacterium]|nr:Asp23/Gls24 family envelope stress response protein [Anaerolineae bacterium]
MAEETRLGKVEITPAAIAVIAGQAVLNCYGVVGMASKSLVGGLAQLLQPDSRRGVEVKLEDDKIIIDLYVVIEYGTRISTVAHNIMSTVKFAVEKALGVPVAQVNVHVQGLRVSSGE